MTSSEIASLENASRSALAWVPEGYHGSNNFGVLLAAAVLLRHLSVLPDASTTIERGG